MPFFSFLAPCEAVPEFGILREVFVSFVEDDNGLLGILEDFGQGGVILCLFGLSVVLEPVVVRPL